MASALESFKILIADSDQQLALVSKQMLMAMGFSNITLTRSGKQALTMIKTGNFDFLITDWHLKDMDGITLIRHIRRDADSPQPTMPVIMLTGRMEQSDVRMARDIGVHEYVVKPFTAKTIYNRLERIVDFPRYFVVGKEFVGPDRRHKLAEAAKERRQKPMAPSRKPIDTAKAIQADGTAKLWLPDYALKHKLGRDVTLESLITPAVLMQAQASIDSATGDSLQWIKEDLVELKKLNVAFAQGTRTEDVANAITEIALLISSRSGTFGYKRASEVAYMLYIFCRNKLQADNPGHVSVIDKHIAVLQIIFGTNIRDGDGGIVQIITELKNLTAKYAP